MRQIERLVLRYRAAGAAGLVSGKRGRPSNHQLPAGKAQRALTIIRDRYTDFGPTLACEKLWECHGIRLAKETVRRLMTDAGLVDSTSTAATEGLSATSASGLPGRTDPDRRQRPSVVRGTRVDHFAHARRERKERNHANLIPTTMDHDAVSSTSSVPG